MQYKPAEKFDSNLNSGDEAADGIVNRVDRLVHDVGNAAMESGKSALHDLQEKSDEVAKDLKSLYGDGTKILRKRIASQPITAITIALAAGALIAGLMIRK